MKLLISALLCMLSLGCASLEDVPVNIGRGIVVKTIEHPETWSTFGYTITVVDVNGRRFRVISDLYMIGDSVSVQGHRYGSNVEYFTIIEGVI